MRTSPASGRRLRGAYLATACAIVLAATSGCASAPSSTAPETPVAEPAAASPGGESPHSPSLVHGTTTNQERLEVPPDAVLLLELPAKFEGELPCADCPGINYRLDLYEDRVFILRTTYHGRGAEAVRDLIGTWTLSSDDNRVALFGGTEAPIFFRILDAGTIRKLDIEGRDIESALDYNLRRKDALDPIEPRLTMRGMYLYMADAALFEECLSGRRFPVSPEGDNVALERAYMDARHEPGEPLLVSLQGSIALRPAMEGGDTVLSLVPERLIGFWPGETCGARMATAELENTYWKLTRLGDQPVIVGERQREPHIVLHQQDGRVAAFGGCNRMTGGYTLEGTRIEFSQLASTMMACAEGMDTEQALAVALDRARSYRIIGQHLDLFDQAGELVARFEARHLD